MPILIIQDNLGFVMKINKVQPECEMSCFGAGGPDAEELAIMRRLKMYGETPTGIKSIDKAKLHQIELREAQRLDYETSKFLTVSTDAQRKIQERKKERRVERNPQAYPNSAKGAKILGDQIYQAIKMKKQLEEKLKKMKKDSKI